MYTKRAKGVLYGFFYLMGFIFLTHETVEPFEPANLQHNGCPANEWTTEDAIKQFTFEWYRNLINVLLLWFLN